MTTAAPPVLKATRENTVKGENIFLNDVKQVVTCMAESVNKVLKMSLFPTVLGVRVKSKSFFTRGLIMCLCSVQVRSWFPR